MVAFGRASLFFGKMKNRGEHFGWAGVNRIGRSLSWSSA